MTSETSQKPKSIDNFNEFQQAVINAQFEKRGFIEVSEKFFRVLTEGQKTSYLTYGKPGIKVYIEGTREGIEAREALTAEQARELEIKEKRKALGL